MKKRKFEGGGIVDNIERESYLEDSEGNPVLSGFGQKIKSAGRAPAPIERKDPDTGLVINRLGDAPIVKGSPPIKPLPSIAAGPPPPLPRAAGPAPQVPPATSSPVRSPEINSEQIGGAPSANKPREAIAGMVYNGQMPVGEPPEQLPEKDRKRIKLGKGRKGYPKTASGNDLIPGLERAYPAGITRKKEGGSVTRGDGIAKRGKTKGRYI